MFIVHHCEFENFIFAIAKDVFCYLYKEDYSFYPNELNDDRKLIATRKGSGEKLAIFLLKRPSEEEIKQAKDKNQTIIFGFIEHKNRITQAYEHLILNEEFIYMYEDILSSFIHNERNSDLIEIMNFSRKYYFNKNMPVDILCKSLPYYVCKYCRDDIKEKHRKAILRGELSFASPVTFNDPFDCDCMISSFDYKQHVRVLSTTEVEDDILMWSYYGGDHKGYCLKYKTSELIHKIIDSSPELLIYGKVDYKKHRPKYKLSYKYYPRLLEILHLVDCTFTKFYGWKHEKEIRFLVTGECWIRYHASTLDNSNKPNDLYCQISVPIHETIRGCESASSDPTERKLSKDDVCYKLN